MIREVEGDILLSDAQVIAHGIAPQDPFDSGLALALRERWPSLVVDYRHAAHAKAHKPGEIWCWAGVDEQGHVRCIVNLLTQDSLHSGHAAKPGKATLKNVSHALRDLAKYVVSENIKSVALPRLATGVGALDWSEVKPLIAKYLGDLNVDVIVYKEYHKGVKAPEQLGQA
jgi:O-acetyl-ADP-ribose deacetylase (regulator of RNase III)